MIALCFQMLWPHDKKSSRCQKATFRLQTNTTHLSVFQSFKSLATFFSSDIMEILPDQLSLQNYSMYYAKYIFYVLLQKYSMYYV